MYIISALGLSGLFSSRNPMEHHEHPLGCAHPTLETTGLDKHSAIGGPRATSGRGPLVTRPAKLFVNLWPVNTSSFHFFLQRIWKKKDSYVTYFLHTSDTSAIDFKILP
jgi:hypothetical protein